MLNIVVCGDLCARRPGDTEARGTILIASRPSVGGSTLSRHAGRASAICGADVFSRAEGFGGRQATTGHRSPNLFLGLGRALQPSEQTRSCLTDRFHLPSSLQTASASYEQEIIGAFGNVRKAFGEIRNVEC